MMLIHLSHQPQQAKGDQLGHTRARVLGELATNLYPNLDWNRIEPLMAADWHKVRGGSRLAWTDVGGEVHAAWQVAKLGSHLVDNAPVLQAA
jgi:hypothetical protein